MVSDSNYHDFSGKFSNDIKQNSAFARAGAGVSKAATGDAGWPRMILRSGTEDDFPALSDVERDAAQRFRAWEGYAFIVDAPIRDRHEQRRALDTGGIIVAEDDGGAVVGFLLLWAVDGRAHFLELGVRRSHQGHGLGRRLLAAGEQWARERGFREATLTAYRDVPWNAPFYARLGFRAFEPGPDRPGLIAVRREEAAAGFAVQPRVAMRKALTPAGA